MGRNLLFATLLVCLAVSVALGETTSVDFRLTDFIPVRFTDLEWTVNGALDLYSVQPDLVYTAMPAWTNPPFLSETSDFSINTQELQFLSSTQYRYETVPRFLNAGLSLSTGWERSSQELSDVVVLSDTLHQSSLGDFDGNGYTAGFDARLLAGQYVASDFFLSVDMEGWFTYRGTPTSDNSHVDEQWAEFADSSMYTVIQEDEEGFGRRNDGFFHVALMPGWGRVYDASYASTALYMVEELNRAGLLLRPPTRDEMTQLTDRLYQYRLTHTVDSRIRRLDALTDILAYLRDIGAAADMSGLAPLLVQDVWDYFPRTIRRFGWRVYVGLGASFERSSYDATRNQNSRFYRQTVIFGPPETQAVLENSSWLWLRNYDTRSRDNLDLRGRLEYFRPLDRKVQLNATADFAWYFDSEEELVYRAYYDGESFDTEVLEETVVRTEYSDHYTLDITGHLDYFVDSRTTLSAFLAWSGLQYETDATRRYFDNRMDTLDASYRLSEWRAQVDLQYRISLPTTLVISGAYRMWDQNVTPANVAGRSRTESDQSLYHLSARVLHYIL